jgi:hypothetical protein
MNRLAKRDLGSENIIGRIWDVQGEGDNQINESFIRHVESVFKTNKTETFEFETHTNSNQNNYFQLSIIPLDNLAGEMPEDVLTITRNITQQNCMSWNLKVILIILSFWQIG